MKTPLLFVMGMFCTAVFAQEHYSGINISRRTGILNATINPAELSNLVNDHEVHVFSFSANAANNKLTFKDLVNGDKDFEDMLFAGDSPSNFRGDVEILGPAFAMKLDKWAFGITTAAKVKASMVDINPVLGRAVTNGGVNNIIEAYNVLSDYNQRASGVSWGEIGLSASRELYNSEEHRFTAGITLNLLFPGSYANMGASGLRGTIRNTNGTVTLEDAHAEVEVAYSGSLANDFTDSSNFTDFFAGGLNGLSTDFGITYQWKEVDTGTNRLNAGLAVRNLGSMRFKDNNNESYKYTLNVPDGEALNLNQFQDAESLSDIVEILEANSQYFTTTGRDRNFRVKMPAMFSAYADLHVWGNFYFAAYTQQKLQEDNNNGQIPVQNIITFTPRFAMKTFEAFIPFSHNEISEFTAGVGFRVGGFFIGSGSILSAAFGNTNQADAYAGFRFGF